MMQERFLKFKFRSLGFFFVQLLIFLAYLEGPENKNKKTWNLLKAEAKKGVQQSTGF